MNTQKGEVAIVVMAVMMATAMIFGMYFMHNGHVQDSNSHIGKEQRQEPVKHDGRHDDKPKPE
jgi:hypothetical protein